MNPFEFGFIAFAAFVMPNPVHPQDLIAQQNGATVEPDRAVSKSA